MPPCWPTSRPCRTGKATSGASSTRSSCAPSPAFKSSQMQPSICLEGRGWFLERWAILRQAALQRSLGPKRSSVFAKVGVLEIGQQRQGLEVDNCHLLPIHRNKLVLAQGAKGAIDVECGKA